MAAGQALLLFLGKDGFPRQHLSHQPLRIVQDDGVGAVPALHVVPLGVEFVLVAQVLEIHVPTLQVGIALREWGHTPAGPPTPQSAAV